MAQNKDILINWATTKALARRLIAVAQTAKVLTYGDAKNLLEQDCGIRGKLTARNIGSIASALQNKLSEQHASAPLLIVLLVNKETKRPGKGIRRFLVGEFPNEDWEAIAFESPPWNKIVKRAIVEAWCYPACCWDSLYDGLDDCATDFGIYFPLR